jgi:hypothetical protein
MTNASAGDTILVGPGVYGDVDGDGAVGNSPGEEIATAGAMVYVNKPLTIRSRDGAGDTIVDVTGTALADVFATVVGNVELGTPNHGFTVRGGVNGIRVGAGPARVRGNRAIGNAVGIAVQTGVGSLVDRNVASYNGSAGVEDAAVGTTVSRNLAVGSPFGLRLIGTGAIVSGNVATANGTGFLLAVAPPGPASPVASFAQNVAVGNGGTGVLVTMLGTFTSDAAVALTQNDYYGNGEFTSSATPNCGLSVTVNDTNGNDLSVTSTTDYWGGAGGPGPNPKDDASAVCNSAVSGTISLAIVAPSPAEFVVLPPAVR